ncbi:MAG: tRNA lysidine(34) synthetase TilS [Sphingomicrobium sp.]
MTDSSEITLQPNTELVERFERDLAPLARPGTRLGLAVSGGADSVAMLFLCAAARPGEIEVASVDHAIRADARKEAEAVGELCAKLGVPHSILTVEWDEKPETGIQERARMARYRLLGDWARDRSIGALVVAHHVDDQAETFVMRLARGVGVKGLSAMRRLTLPPGGKIALIRPLLNWRRSELEQICKDCGVSPSADPSNDDEQFERVRIRKALGASDWLDPAAIAKSATNLARADSALHWAATQEWRRAVTNGGGALVYTPGNAPIEIRRRIASRAVMRLASEGRGTEPRGREMDQLVAALVSGRKATLRGVLCSGGKQWRFSRAPARRAKAEAN